MTERMAAKWTGVGLVMIAEERLHPVILVSSAGQSTFLKLALRDVRRVPGCKSSQTYVG